MSTYYVPVLDMPPLDYKADHTIPILLIEKQAKKD